MYNLSDAARRTMLYFKIKTHVTSLALLLLILDVSDKSLKRIKTVILYCNSAMGEMSCLTNNYPTGCLKMKLTRQDSNLVLHQTFILKNKTLGQLQETENKAQRNLTINYHDLDERCVEVVSFQNIRASSDTARLYTYVLYWFLKLPHILASFSAALHVNMLWYHNVANIQVVIWERYSFRKIGTSLFVIQVYLKHYVILSTSNRWRATIPSQPRQVSFCLKKNVGDAIDI